VGGSRWACSGAARVSGPEASAAGVTAAGWRNGCSAGPVQVLEGRRRCEGRATSEALAQRLARRSSRPRAGLVLAARQWAWRVSGERSRTARSARQRSVAPAECSAVREHRASSFSRRVVLEQREGHQRLRSRTREEPHSQKVPGHLLRAGAHARCRISPKNRHSSRRSGPIHCRAPTTSARARRLGKALRIDPMFRDRQQLRVEPLYLDKTEAAAYLSVSVSTFEKLLREDATFPRPRALSAKRNGYLVMELRAWGETRPIADRLPPANTNRRANGVRNATAPAALGVRSVW